MSADNFEEVLKTYGQSLQCPGAVLDSVKRLAYRYFHAESNIEKNKLQFF